PRLGILQHAADLLLQHCLVVQLVLAGEREQLLVGHAAPQEVAEPRGQLVVRDRLEIGRASCGERAGVEVAGGSCAESGAGCVAVFFFSSRRRHTRSKRDWSSACALPISRALGSFSMRRICSSSTVLSCSWFWPASVNSSSSGMLLHRK